RKPDGKSEVLVWDMSRKAEKSRLALQGSASLAFRPGTTQLILTDGVSLVLADAQDGKELFRWDTGHKLGPNRLAWQSANRLVSTGPDGALKVWEFSEAPPLTSLHLAAGPTLGLSFSPDGKWLSVGPTAAPEVWVMDRQTGTPARKLAW